MLEYAALVASPCALPDGLILVFQHPVRAGEMQMDIRKKLNIRKLLNILSYPIVIGSFIFLLVRLFEYKEMLKEIKIGYSLMLFMGLSILLHFSGMIVLARAWSTLLKLFSKQIFSTKTIYKLYAKTQIGKYLPGNVMHFASRHMVGTWLGLKQAALGLVAIYEIIGLLFASSLLCLIGFYYSGLEIRYVGKIQVFIFFAMAAVVPVFIQYIMKILTEKRSYDFFVEIKSVHFMSLYKCFAYYFIYFAIIGVALLILMSPSGIAYDAKSVGIILFGFSIAFIAGYITPGSPAGLGVREAVLVAILSNVIGGPESMAMALMFRVVATVADLLFFLSSFLVKDRLVLKEGRTPQVETAM
jgi:uncharacterized membrane protein YbhN (UPF0104 family)